MDTTDTELAEQQECLTLYREQNYSPPQISAATGIPVHRVRIRLKQAGVELSIGKRSAKSQKFPALRDLIEQGVFPAEAARQTGVAYQTALRWLREEGYDTGGLSPDEQKRAEFAPLCVQRYQADRSVTLKQLAEEYQVGEKTVSRWLKDDGVEIRFVPHTNASKRDRLPEAIRLNEEGVSLQQIGKQIDVAWTTVAYWFRQEGIVPTYADDTSEAAQARRDEHAAAKQRAIEVYLASPSLKEAAEQAGIAESTMYRYVTEAGVRFEGGSYAQRRETTDEVVRLYEVDLLTLEQTAERVGLSQATVRAMLVSRQVRIRNSYEQKTPAQIADMRQAAAEAKRGRRQPVRPVPRPEPRRTPTKAVETSFPACIAPGCEVSVSAKHLKYCSVEHAQMYSRRRQRNDDDYVMVVCQNEQCPLPEREFEIHLRERGKRKYCSNACAHKHTRTKHHIALRDDDVLLDSAWEGLVWSLGQLLNLGLERFDRARGVQWDQDNPESWYAPDFWSTRSLVAIEVKGVQDPDDERRWSAYREQRGPLLVLTEADMAAIVADSSQLHVMIKQEVAAAVGGTE